MGKRKNQVFQNPPMTTSAADSQGTITFPTSAFQRVRTPVKRVPSGKMWSQPDRYIPTTYGGSS